MPSIMRERNSIPAHGMTASGFSRESLEQPELFLPLRDLFSLIQCRLDRITKLPAGSLSRRVPQGGFGASYAPYPHVRCVITIVVIMHKMATLGQILCPNPACVEPPSHGCQPMGFTT